jgi:hypothetical protein
MQQNLIDNTIYELDMIRILSRFSIFSLINDSKEIERGSFELIFEDIEKRCWQISENIEKLQNIF